MKKTLIALALTTLPVAAMAEVTLYGQIKAGFETASSKTDGADRTSWANGITDYGSRIGFKGSEDLGNGLKAIWQVEANTPVAGGETFTNRQSFIGLASDFGTIRAGKVQTFQKSDMGDVDAWEYGNSALGLGNFTRNDGTLNGVRYDSPDFAGFRFALGYSTNDVVSTAGTALRGQLTDENGNVVSTGTSQDTYNLGLAYENSGIFGKYSLLYVPHGAGEKDTQSHRVEVGYDANNLFAAVGYQNVRHANNDDATGLKVGVSTWNGLGDQGQEAAVTFGYHFGNVFPKISYAHGWDVKADGEKVANTKYDQVVLGADYSFSKRTTANAQVGWVREGNGPADDSKTKTTAVGVGLKHVF